MHDERTARYPGEFSLDTAVRDGALEMILGGEIDMGAAFKLESSRAGQLGIAVSVSRVSEPVQRVLDVAGLGGTIGA